MNNLRVTDRVRKLYFNKTVVIDRGLANFSMSLDDIFTLLSLKNKGNYAKIKSISIQWQGSYAGTETAPRAVNVFGGFEYNVKIFGRQYTVTATNSIGPDVIWNNRNKDFFYHGFIPLTLYTAKDEPFSEKEIFSVDIPEVEGTPEAAGDINKHAFRVDVTFELI